jgi:hypothetical protein
VIYIANDPFQYQTGTQSVFIMNARTAFAIILKSVRSLARLDWIGLDWIGTNYHKVSTSGLRVSRICHQTGPMIFFAVPVSGNLVLIMRLRIINNVAFVEN